MTDKRVEICKLDVYLVKARGLFNFNPFHKLTWQWQAHAVGLKGPYLAAWSGTFKAMGNTDLGPTNNLEVVQKARQEVLSIMLREGWIPLNSDYREQAFTREIE